jgi:hypothetical protein
LTIFGETIGVFLKNQCYDQFFQNLALFRVKNANFLAKFFGENIFKIITLVPVSLFKFCTSTNLQKVHSGVNGVNEVAGFDLTTHGVHGDDTTRPRCQGNIS